MSCSECPLAYPREGIYKLASDADGPLEVRYELRKGRDILLCGESPGRQEEEENRPFVGRAGQLLNNSLRDAGIERSEVSIINATRCRLPADIKGTESAILPILKACRPNVDKAIEKIKPKVIVALGNIALRQIEPSKRGITKYQGAFFRSTRFPGVFVMPAYHPAYCLRNPSMTPRLVEALQRVADLRAQDWVIEEFQGKYTEVETIQILFKKQPHYIAIDTETQGLDWMRPNCLMLSYSVSWTSGQAFNIVLFEETDDKPDFTIIGMRKDGRSKVETEIKVKKARNFDLKVNELLDLCANPDIKKIMMNGNFDIHFIQELAKRFSNRRFVLKGYVFDIQAAAHCFNENLYNMASLELLQRDFILDDALAALRSDDYSTRFAADFDKFDMIAALTNDRDRFTEYSCKDANVTYCVGKELRKQLNTKLNKRILNYYRRFVHPTLKTLRLMEKNGALIDLKALPAAKDTIATEMSLLESRCLDLAPARTKLKHKDKGLQLTRRDFVKDVVFSRDGFGLNPIETTRTGQPKFDKDTRKLLLESPIRFSVREFINNYEKWSESHTMFTRYLTGFEKAVCQDERIHTRYSLVAAVTGRVASSNPNLMNVPKRTTHAKVIRRLIRAPEKKLLLAADQAQSELRWIAHIANEKAMIEVFRAGKDIHLETGLALTRGRSRSIPGHRMSKEEIEKARFHAKAVNFGLIYLMSVKGFINYAKLEYGIDLDQDTAEEWVNTFFRKYPRLNDYHEYIIETCEEFEYVESPLGRRRRLPEIRSDDFGVANYAKRQAVNHPVQSASSDCVLLALNEMRQKKVFKKLRFRPILFIHDELVFEVPSDVDRIDEIWACIKEEMENPPLKRLFGFQLRVPLVAEAKLGKNLADMESL